MVVRTVTLIASAMILAGCQPQDAEVSPAAPSATAPKAAASPAGATMDISQPIVARGTEPFWAIRVTNGKTLTYSAPGEPDRVFEAQGAAVSPGRATWVAQGPGGEQVTLTMYASDCSDGMSDLRYPWAAEAAMPNRLLHGCAGKASELPREGETPAKR
ncbi:MAG: hypothetical protein U1C74_03995 [Phenylobacterium sp.]|nr:hypothetical protein [Phenylobacterium sp.]